MSEEEDGEIVVTEFGPIDRRSRRLLGYLILFIMFGFATGISWSFITTVGLEMGMGFAFMIIAMIYGLAIGMPYIAFFGEKQPPSRPVQYRTSRPRSTGRRPRIKYKTTEAGGGFTETVSYEEPPQQQLETIVEGQPKTDKKQKVSDFSYRGEYPKKRRRAYEK